MKKILSLLLVIAMMVTLAVTVSAEETTAYDLYVGGVQITDDNKDDIVTAINDAANATVATGSATYDPDSKTLTLANFSYTGEGYEHDVYTCAAIISLNDLIVNLVGSNTLNCTDSEVIDVNGSLTIQGSDKDTDTLTVTSLSNNILASDITISKATITADDMTAFGNLSITGSIVNTDDNKTQASISAWENFNISSSTINLNADNSGLGADEKLTITESTIITAEGKGSFIGSSGDLEIVDSEVTVAEEGIAADDSLTIRNSTVTATGANFGIAVMGSMSVSGSSTVTATGGVLALCTMDGERNLVPLVPTFTGDYAVYAGDDAESAVKVDSPTDATYASKYVKIGPHTATITVEMEDLAGDGWDDQAKILVLSVPDFSDMEGDEDILGVFTLEDGVSGTQTLNIDKNQTVYFFWLFDNDGEYNYEASFTIKRDGMTIYTHADETDECPLTNWQRLVISEPIDARPTTITYEVAPTFTVTIPATVALGEDATISADNVVVKKGQQVEVSLTDANGFAVTSAEGAELIYTVKNGEAAVAEGDIVLAVNPKDGKTGSTTLTFVAPTEYTYSGDYTGTVTFTVAVKDDPIISFTLNGTVYQAEEGMTLCQWAESEYDVNDKYYDAGDGTVQVNGSWGFLDDVVIVDGESYWMAG